MHILPVHGYSGNLRPVPNRDARIRNWPIIGASLVPSYIVIAVIGL